MANAAPITRSDIYVALAKRGAFEVLQENETPSQLRISGRCQLDRWPFFGPIIHTLISASDKPGSPWTCDVSKKYIILNDKLLYTWRLIFQGQDLASQYPSIIATIMNAPRPGRVEVTSQLLPGYKPGDVRGGVNERGKGSAPAGTVPMAVTRQRR